MKEALSEARKSTALATSSGAAHRLMGVSARTMSSVITPSRFSVDRLIPVLTYPGATVLTRTLLSAKSSASAFVSEVTPPLLAMYGAL